MLLVKEICTKFEESILQMFNSVGYDENNCEAYEPMMECNADTCIIQLEEHRHSVVVEKVTKEEVEVVELVEDVDNWFAITAAN